MNSTLANSITEIILLDINQERRNILQPMIDYIQPKIAAKSDVNINFICTHNSRRSHLAQVWAQVAAAYYHIPGVHCYSGGTEVTAVFPKIATTLDKAGMNVHSLSPSPNPIYALKFAHNALPIIAFSKKYDDAFNPQRDFAAIMTCSQADADCPFILGAEKRIPITYEDPKVADDTAQQDEVYHSRSLQIASEMFYVFSRLKK